MLSNSLKGTLDDFVLALRRLSPGAGAAGADSQAERSVPAPALVVDAQPGLAPQSLQANGQPPSQWANDAMIDAPKVAVQQSPNLVARRISLPSGGATKTASVLGTGAGALTGTGMGALTGSLNVPQAGVVSLGRSCSSHTLGSTRSTPLLAPPSEVVVATRAVSQRAQVIDDPVQNVASSAVATRATSQRPQGTDGQVQNLASSQAARSPPPASQRSLQHAVTGGGPALARFLQVGSTRSPSPQTRRTQIAPQVPTAGTL